MNRNLFTKFWLKTLPRLSVQRLIAKNSTPNFENRLLRPGEDPAVFLWELTQLLHEGEPIAHRGRQNGSFGAAIYAWTTSQDLPQTPGTRRSIIVRRYEHFASNSTAHLSTGKNDPPEIPDMSTLVAAVKALQVEQQSLRNEIAQQRQQARPVSTTRGVTYYEYGERGHYARTCQYRQNTSRSTANNPSLFSNFNRVCCSNCHRLGHVASNCFRPLNGPEGTYAGSIGHPSKTTCFSDNNFSFLPTHPLVEICTEGINVIALLYTGSLKSFINENIQAALDFNNVRNKPVDPGRYISITGDPLNIKYKISCNVKFPKRKMFYQGDILVSRNIRHDCVLGWDFIAYNGQTLRAAENNGRHSYFVQGRRGISPIFSQPPGTGSHLSGVVWDSGDVKQPWGPSNVLLQSKVRGGTPVTLAEMTIVPPHSEVIVEGRITRSVDFELGMVSPLTGQQRDNLGVHVEYVVAQATSRTVPVRIANTSEDEVEIVSGRKIAEFSVLSESPICNNSSTANTNPDPFCCSSVDTSNLLDEIEVACVQTSAAIDPSLNREDKAK